MVNRPLRRLAVLCALAATMSCGAMRLERRTGSSLDAVDARAPRLKVHTRDGEVYVLSQWKRAPDGIIGRGERWGPDRSRRDADASYRIELGDVALFETDTRRSSPANLPMGLLTAGSAVLSVLVIGSVLALFNLVSGFEL